MTRFARILVLSVLLFSFGFAANCQVITSSGTYTQAQDYVGSPNNAAPQLGYACVKIAASNVLYDCDGYNITGNSSDSNQRFGIIVNGSYTNVTIRNCPGISNYSSAGSAGVNLRFAQNSSVQNVTASGNYDGFWIIRAQGDSVTYSTAADNSHYGFWMLDSNLSTLANNSASGNEYGFYVGTSYSLTSYNDTLIDNSASGNSQYGFLLSSSRNCVVSNNIAINNFDGFHLYGGWGDQINNDTAVGNTNAGIMADSSTFLSVSKNTAYWNLDGIHVLRTNSPNTFTGNTVYGNTGNGFFLNMSNYSYLDGNEVHENTNAGVYIYRGSHNTLGSDKVHINTNAGVYVYGGSYNTMNGTASYQNLYGFLINNSVSNSIDRSNATYNSQHGIYLVDSHSNRIYQSNASNNSQYGIYLSNSYYNAIHGSEASKNHFGYFLYQSYGNTADQGSAFGNRNSGFYIDRSYRNNISNSVAYANLGPGFYVGGENNTLLNDTSYGQTSYAGVYVNSNNTIDRNGHYYNNMIDYDVDARDSGFVINATNISIDNPAGGFANYTMLSFSDRLQTGEEYQINWANASGLPPGRMPFLGKFVGILVQTGSPAIDSITWGWRDSELAGHNAQFFELWRYNSSSEWELLNDTPDVSADRLSLTNLDPEVAGSTYGILEQGSCPVITHSGSYQLEQNAVGAPNLVPVPVAYSQEYACVDIAASNVVFDCNGYTITDNGTALLYPTYGILLNGHITNVTVQNCPGVSNYKHGVYAWNSSDSTIATTTSYGNKEDGFRVDYSTNIYLRYDNGSDNEIYGFEIYSGNTNWLYGNTADQNLRTGYYIHNSQSNHLIINTAADSVENGLVLANSPSCSLDGNSVSGSGSTGYAYAAGYYIYNSSNSNLSNNVASGNKYYAVYINSSSSITLTGMVMNNQTYLIGPPGGSPLEITNLTATNGTSSVTFGSVDYTSASGLNDSSVIIGDGMVAVDSSAVPEFNTSARITMWTPSCSPPKIYVLDEYPVTRYDVLGRGRLCTEPECTIVSCTGNTIIFDVLHFSGYASGGETGLTITNDGPKYWYETTTFTANYVNITDGNSHIPGANCTLYLYNGSAYAMSEAVDHYELGINVTEIGTHDYNVTCSKAGFATLTAFDTFTIFYNGSSSGVDLYGTNITVISESRYGSNAAANHTTEGGNVTELNLTGNESTDRWAGYFGNITSVVVLAQDLDTAYMFNWSWNSSYGGVVCASTASAPISTIMGATYADIDTAWSFNPTASDSSAKTFSNANCSQKFGGTNMSDAYYADTGLGGGFITCAWKSAFTPSKDEMLFCTNITNNGPLYNGESGDFEIIAPTEYGTGVYETYYFYLSLG